jgi:hypothetical protein
MQEGGYLIIWIALSARICDNIRQISMVFFYPRQVVMRPGCLGKEFVQPDAEEVLPAGYGDWLRGSGSHGLFHGGKMKPRCEKYFVRVDRMRVFT